ncbi:hypothetical protein ACFYOV_18245 [Streptomyces sp. NPDC005931]|uniref:hypothetical protein n=1 Tax=Streptomyces sp. NPDC005931 TaxID=3364737 RepID=UPI0036755951
MRTATKKALVTMAAAAAAVGGTVATQGTAQAATTGFRVSNFADRPLDMKVVAGPGGGTINKGLTAGKSEVYNVNYNTTSNWTCTVNYAGRTMASGTFSRAEFKECLVHRRGDVGRLLLKRPDGSEVERARINL